MTEPTPDPVAAFEAEAAAQLQAQAVAAQANLAPLAAIRATLAGAEVDGLLASLDAAQDLITDPPARQSLWNMASILRSARRTLESAEARLTALAAQAEDQGEGA